jgi:hypothetical protein
LLSRGLFRKWHNDYPDRTDFENHVKTYSFPAGVENQIFRTRAFTPKIFVPAFTTRDKRITYQMEPDTSSAHFIYDTQGDTTSFWDQGDLVEFLLDFENQYPQLKTAT